MKVLFKKLLQLKTHLNSLKPSARVDGYDDEHDEEILAAVVYQEMLNHAFLQDSYILWQTPEAAIAMNSQRTKLLIWTDLANEAPTQITLIGEEVPVKRSQAILEDFRRTFGPLLSEYYTLLGQAESMYRIAFSNWCCSELSFALRQLETNRRHERPRSRQEILEEVNIDIAKANIVNELHAFVHRHRERPE